MFWRNPLVLTIQYRWSPLSAEAAPLLLPEPTPELPASSGTPGTDHPRVSHLIYGPPQAIEATLKQLHVLGYAERFRWNPIVAVPENGIYISPAEAQAYTFLMRELRLE